MISQASSRSSSGNIRGSRHSFSNMDVPAPAPHIDLPAQKVWSALQKYISRVGEDRFNRSAFEDTLREWSGQPSAELNYKTSQRVKLACDRYFGSSIHAEFD